MPRYNVGREDIFKPTEEKKSLEEINDNNGVRVVYFDTFESLIVKSTKFPHCNIQKFSWISAGKTLIKFVMY
jgi:hypothetical protein